MQLHEFLSLSRTALTNKKHSLNVSYTCALSEEDLMACECVHYILRQAENTDTVLHSQATRVCKVHVHVRKCTCRMYPEMSSFGS